jgi:hypothetical protein
MGAPSGRRNRISGQFAPRLIEMLEAPVYRALSLSARRVLDRVEIELGHHGGNDNGRLPVTYENFVSYGIERHAIAPAIREAVALGLLEVTERGCAGNAESRSPNLYRLTFRPAKGYPGDYGTDEWRRIETMEAAQELARSARRQVDHRRYRPSKGHVAGIPDEKKRKPVREKTQFRWGKPALKTTIPQCGNPPQLQRWRIPHYSRYLGVGREARP